MLSPEHVHALMISRRKSLSMMTSITMTTKDRTIRTTMPITLTMVKGTMTRAEKRVRLYAVPGVYEE